MQQYLADSYRECLGLARRSGSNFYYSFFTLPRDLFRDTCVLYAYMRHTDDLGDDQALTSVERRTLLADWRRELDRALSGGACTGIFPALADVADRHGIPGEFLREVIAGVESDLEPKTIETRTELEHYCYQVAGVVGLCCIRIWGYSGIDAEKRALHCGMAFQLTNILRDLSEDAKAGRIYLPAEDLRRFRCTADDLRTGGEALRGLIRYEAEWAREHYIQAQTLRQNLTPPGRRIFSAMLGIYGGLLNEIERRRYDVFSRRVDLPAWRKWIIVGGALSPIGTSLDVRRST